MKQRKLKFAIMGCGFWSYYQICAWKELEPQVELVAVCDSDIEKAKSTAEKFHVPNYYFDATELIENEDLDFIDIITSVETHEELVRMVMENKIAVICQKPMTLQLSTAEALVNECVKGNTPFFVHENFRWQKPLRRLRSILDSGVIGNVFKARISFCSAFPVFENQPFLKELDQFILTDVGSHVLDVVRFLLGEVESLYCRIKSVTPGIKGEDVANVFLEMKSGAHCFVEMSYASILEKEVFPQTLVHLEGSQGSIQLYPDFLIKTTTRKETISEEAQPFEYSWVNPDYAIVHSSMVDIHKDFVEAYLSKGTPETTGNDNLETLRLVFAAYESAKTNQVVTINGRK